MKILGISCGRPNGNSEILLKEALMGAEEVGVEVEMIRLNDFEITPCIGCGGCYRPNQDGINDCVYDDDFPQIMDLMLSADGVIVAAPIYVWAPSGNIRVLADRLGPTHDIPLLKQRGAHLPESTMDKRLFKPWKAGLITVGGTTNPKYASMGLAPMRQFTHSMQMQVVDQMMCLDSTLPGDCLKHPEKIEHAHAIGRNVAEALGKSEEEVSYKGELGTCPCCHCDMLMIENGTNKVKCPWCIVEGEIKADENGELYADFSKADLANWRSSTAEMESHGREIAAQMADFDPAWKEDVKRYSAMKFPTTKPEVSKLKLRKRS